MTVIEDLLKYEKPAMSCFLRHVWPVFVGSDVEGDNRLGLTTGCSFLVQVLSKKNARYGVAGVCNGGGGASALVLERL
jgi:hypothetical protein